MTSHASISVSDARIRQARCLHNHITLLEQGQPLANQPVTVRQKKHALLLGANWGEGIAYANDHLSGAAKEAAERRNALFFDLFNSVTMPFYWANYEPRQGEPATRHTMVGARWYQQQGCLPKGHPLCWHTLCPQWLLAYSPDEVLKLQLERIQRDVSDFAGLIDTWDVINEAVIMPVFYKYDNAMTRLCKKMGRIPLIRALFQAARAANPHATLLINDFDVSPAYDILVEGCLEAGIAIDVIGIQSHMHQGVWGKEKTEWVLERFARFGLPLHFTENTILSGHLMPPDLDDLNDYKIADWASTPEGEELQKQQVLAHYQTLVANPLVESIVWWDFADGAWLGAPAGLLRLDRSPKPAYTALHDLVKGEWWLPETALTSDENGQISLNGFAGEYEISAKGKTWTVALNESGQTCQITAD